MKFDDENVGSKQLLVAYAGPGAGMGGRGMRITREDVLHIARLAELAVDDAEVERSPRSSTTSWGTWRSSMRCRRNREPSSFIPGPASWPGAPTKCVPSRWRFLPPSWRRNSANGFFVVPRLTGMEDA